MEFQAWGWENDLQVSMRVLTPHGLFLAALAQHNLPCVRPGSAAGLSSGVAVGQLWFKSQRCPWTHPSRLSNLLLGFCFLISKIR